MSEWRIQKNPKVGFRSSTRKAKMWWRPTFCKKFKSVNVVGFELQVSNNLQISINKMLSWSHLDFKKLVHCGGRWRDHPRKTPLLTQWHIKARLKFEISFGSGHTDIAFVWQRNVEDFNPKSTDCFAASVTGNCFQVHEIMKEKIYYVDIFKHNIRNLLQKANI